MINKHLVVIVVATLTGCAQPTGPQTQSAQDASALITDSLHASTDSNGLYTAGEAPTTVSFGCSELKKFKYPMHWPGHEEGLEQPKGKEFEDVGKYFAELHAAAPLSKVQVNEIEVVRIGEETKEQGFDASAIQSMGQCLYQLPKMGIYDCYYFYAQTKTKPLGNYGNLLLLDPATKNGKLLNIYFEYGGEQHVKYRYFLIEDQTIRLYEGACYDDGCGLKEAFLMRIQADGGVEKETIH